MSFVEQEYLRLLDTLAPAQKMRRAAELWAWSQDVIARHILANKGPMSDERLKWEVAAHRYGDEAQLGHLIRKELERVSG